MFGIPEEFVQKCVDRFNPEDQLDRLIEECSELTKACCKLKREDGLSREVAMDSLKEELAHVAISSAVVSQIYRVAPSDIHKEVEKKRRKYNL